MHLMKTTYYYLHLFHLPDVTHLKPLKGQCVTMHLIECVNMK